MPEEKKERRDDLVGTESGRSDSSGREKASSGAGVLSLSGSSMSEDGKGEKEGDGVLGDNGFSISFDKRFFKKRSGLR